jgi:hypothetical protein
LKTGYAIGNGLSREGVDLGSLDGLVVGCNGLYKDFSPDILVSLDARVEVPEERDFKWLHLAETRVGLLLDDRLIGDVRDLFPFPGFDSGMVACAYLARYSRCATVYMIGFDFYTGYGGRNDIYHDEAVKNSIPMTNWNLLADFYPDTDFVRLGPWRDEYSELKGLTFGNHRP